MDPVFARILCRLFPVRNDHLVPLVLENLMVFGRPAIGGPIGHLVPGRAAGTAGESDNDRNLELLGKSHRAAERFRIALGYPAVGMHGVAVAT